MILQRPDSPRRTRTVRRRRPRARLSQLTLPSTLVALAALTASRPLHAADVARGALGSGERVAVELGASVTASPDTPAVRTFAASPNIGVMAKVAERWSLSFDGALAMTSYRVAGDERRDVLRAGNLLVGLHATIARTERQDLRVGLIAGAPLVTAPGTIPKNAAASFSDRVAFAMRGGQQAWLWADNAVPALAVVRAGWRGVKDLELVADVQGGLLASVNRNASRFALLAGVTAFYTGGPVEPGLALHTYAQSSPISDRDFAQTSGSVLLRWRIGDAQFRAEYTRNIDPPLGFGTHDVTHGGVAVFVGRAF